LEQVTPTALAAAVAASIKPITASLNEDNLLVLIMDDCIIVTITLNTYMNEMKIWNAM
jgi:hypothetical protein